MSASTPGTMCSARCRNSSLVLTLICIASVLPMYFLAAFTYTDTTAFTCPHHQRSPVHHPAVYITQRSPVYTKQHSPVQIISVHLSITQVSTSHSVHLSTPNNICLSKSSAFTCPSSMCPHHTAFTCLYQTSIYLSKFTVQIYSWCKTCMVIKYEIWNSLKFSYFLHTDSQINYHHFVVKPVTYTTSDNNSRQRV